jgi:hypothetical protein
VVGAQSGPVLSHHVKDRSRMEVFVLLSTETGLRSKRFIYTVFLLLLDPAPQSGAVNYNSSNERYVIVWWAKKQQKSIVKSEL